MRKRLLVLTDLKSKDHVADLGVEWVVEQTELTGEVLVVLAVKVDRVLVSIETIV